MLWICLFALALAGDAALLEESHLPYLSSCPEPTGLQNYAHPDSCHVFYKCANETLTEELCGHGLLFDATRQFCDYHWRVDCEDRYSEVVPHTSGPCDYDFSQQLAGPCEKYYVQCKDRVPQEVPCLEGLAYDNRTRSCNYADLMIEEFNCDPEQIVGFQCPESIDPASLTAQFEPYPRFASDDCGSFIVCVNGYPRRNYCGDYLAFDEQTLSCQDPSNVPNCS